MRTIILVAAWSIADAINKDWINESSDTVGFCTTVLAVSILMDIIEFIKKVRK